jgi:hypothetical protein
VHETPPRLTRVPACEIRLAAGSQQPVYFVSLHLDPVHLRSAKGFGRSVRSLSRVVPADFPSWLALRDFGLSRIPNPYSYASNRRLPVPPCGGGTGSQPCARSPTTLAHRRLTRAFADLLYLICGALDSVGPPRPCVTGLRSAKRRPAGPWGERQATGTPHCGPFRTSATAMRPLSEL